MKLAFGRSYVLQVDSPGSPTTMTLRVTDPLAGLEVGDGRAPSPVLHAPDHQHVAIHALQTQLASLLAALQAYAV